MWLGGGGEGGNDVSDTYVFRSCLQILVGGVYLAPPGCGFKSLFGGRVLGNSYWRLRGDFYF